MSDGGFCHYCRRAKCICTLRESLGRFTREEIASIFQIPLRMLPGGIFAASAPKVKHQKPATAKPKPTKETFTESKRLELAKFAEDRTPKRRRNKQPRKVNNCGMCRRPGCAGGCYEY